MTGALAAAGPGYKETLADLASYGTMAPLGATGTRSLGLGGAGVASLSGHRIFEISCEDNSGPNVFEWLRDGASSNYEARVTVTSGSLSTGTTGSWLNLGSLQTWTKASGPTVTLSLEIGRAGTSAALTTGTVTL